jgi:predicted chitinase
MDRKPYTTPDQLYYGRGFVQLTWYENYQKAGKKFGIDLLNNPDLACDLQIATDIMFEGMIHGWFTGRKLSQYFSATKTDWINARKIINGRDKDVLIAGYAQAFFNGLK